MTDEKIKYVEMRLVDINGQLRGMSVPLSKPVDSIEEIRDDERIIKGVNVDGSSLPGFAAIENSDAHLVPDMDSLVELHHLGQRKAAVLCDLYNRTETSDAEIPFMGDARSLLKRTIKEHLGEKTVKIKPEPEFYIIEDHGVDNSMLIPTDLSGYIDLAPRDNSADLMMYFADVLREMGIGVHYFHHEVGPAQQEFEIAYNDVIKNVDALVTLKPTIKSIALDNECRITFMPKPFADEAGSGLHVHMQLWDGDKNLFGDYENNEISDFARYFIAGIMEHIPAITAIANPSINSYKRLVPGFEAPVYITWGYRNRSTLLRVPMFRDASKVAVEVRSPDFTCNPYLLLTTLIVAGMEGVNRKLIPPEARKDDVYELSEEERKEQNIENLPTNLGEALDALEQDELILNALGSHIGPAWLKMKRKEWQKYNNLTVTDFEINTYLDC